MEDTQNKNRTLKPHPLMGHGPIVVSEKSDPYRRQKVKARKLIF